jgi:hypothetical protein
MTSKLRPGRKYTSSGLRGMGRVQRAIWRALVASNGRPLSTRELAAWAWPRLKGEPENKHLSSICHAAAEKAKASIAAMMPNPASAKFYKLKRAVKKLPDESVHGICGYVKGKNASGGDTGQLPFLYIIRDDRDGEAYLVDGTSYTAQTVHSVLCK